MSKFLGAYNVIVEEIHLDRDENASAKAKVILHALEHDADHNVVVDKIDVDRKHKYLDPRPVGPAILSVALGRLRKPTRALDVSSSS